MRKGRGLMGKDLGKGKKKDPRKKRQKGIRCRQDAVEYAREIGLC